MAGERGIEPPVGRKLHGRLTACCLAIRQLANKKKAPGSFSGTRGFSIQFLPNRPLSRNTPGIRLLIRVIIWDQFHHAYNIPDSLIFVNNHFVNKKVPGRYPLPGTVYSGIIQSCQDWIPLYGLRPDFTACR